MRLAWVIAVANVTVGGVGLVLGGGPDAIDILYGGFLLAFSGAGALVATRQPRNPIGWLFLGIGAAVALAVVAHAYADYGHAEASDPSLLARTAAWYGNVSWIPFMLPGLTFLLLLFPDGRLLSRRWRPVAWCSGAGIMATFVAAGLTPGRLEDYPGLANPYGWDSPLVDVLEGVSLLLLLVALIGCPASLVARFRRARHEQRQQIKWLAFAGAVAAATFIAGLLLMAVVDHADELVVYVPMMLSVLGLPAAAGIAILRYRLYDIDVVINRALVYGALTGTLVASYLGIVLVLQLALSPLTEQSDLAIAGSTLAVAALFGPVRARIQAAVDRRFYRRRYDAAQTLESFGARLRDEVDLDALGAELRTVVAATLAPAHVSLWLRAAR